MLIYYSYYVNIPCIHYVSLIRQFHYNNKADIAVAVTPNEIAAALLYMYIMIRNIHIRLINGLTYHTSHFKTMK